ncbi:LOW QUALITY PROTEIN: calmodulin-binding transcription activator 2-like [Scleropages formosus]|uniref:LOW QUALITY PROTEIN: calmodulin-binding transcription activator 2-like n=1 Tax=Scleropages formosus TaxID=113540 RepID=UPI0010FAAC97|nr:LOW QUALITY PROTEIN: calmodulin-binding transcription activator 2-like [Scleropages formosus]
MSTKESPAECGESTLCLRVCAENGSEKRVTPAFGPNKLLEAPPCSAVLPKERFRWNADEEIASYLISFDRHEEWLTSTLRTRPLNGSVILYNRKKVKYRKDGYCWKKRKDGKTTREDHMKLKVQGVECLYSCYVHSAIVPTFHRRCYWLLQLVPGFQNPDMVLVHYLNVLSLEGCGAMSGPLLCVSGDRRDSQCWTREELHSQLKPMFYSTKWSCSDSSGAPDFSVDHLVQNVLETRQAKPQPRTCSCLCSTTLAVPGANIPHHCVSTKHQGSVGGDRKAAGCLLLSPVTPSTRFGGDRETLATVALPQSAFIVMATAFGRSRENLMQNLNFSGTDIAHPSMAHPASLVSAAAPSLAVAAPCSCAKSLLSSTPGVAVLSLNLPLRPISGGTFTSDRLVSGCNSPGSLPLPASSPCCPLAFDPDSFLNSSKRGQAYGGTSQSSCVSASLAPDIPSLALPLCPSSLPSSPSRSPLAEVGCGRSSATGLPVSMAMLEVESQDEGPKRVEYQEHQEHQECGQRPVPEQPLTRQEARPHSEQPVQLRPSAQSLPGGSEIGLGVPLGGPAAVESPVPVKEEQSFLATPPSVGPRQCLWKQPDSQLPDLMLEFLGGGQEQQDEQLEASGSSHTHPSPPFPAAVCCVAPPPLKPAPSFLAFPSLTSSLQSGAGAEQRHLAIITDFSPEWSYPEVSTGRHGYVRGSGDVGSVSVCVSVCAMSHSLFGPFCHVTVTSCDRFWLFLKLGALLPQGGVTVLITGPWTETSGCYSCVFDQSTVPASLIQPGVLRCYCPTHEVGLVALQVLEGMAAVSSSVLFEYRARSMASLPSLQLDWPSLDDNQFRMSILERLEQMEKRMAEMTSPTGGTGQQPQGTQRGPVPEAPVADESKQSPSGSWFEQRIVALFERMMAGGRWGGGSEKLIHSVRHRGMTLLHLAAAQGYTKLIHTLIHWRSVNSDSLDLEEEVDPLNVDHFSCTPLMWACALGHQGAAVLLYRWNSLALGIPDSLGRLPLTVARSRGHSHLARRLEEMHAQSTDPEELWLETTDPGELRVQSCHWGHASTCRQHPFLQLPLSPISTSPDTGLSCSSSTASPSPSSAYSSCSMLSSPRAYSPPEPMDISMPPPPHASVPLLAEVPDTSNPGLPAPRRDHTSFEAELLSYSENAENEDLMPSVEDLQVDMVALAEQIIEATPERIKQEEFPGGAESPLRERRGNSAIQDTMPWLASYLDNVDSQPSLSLPSRCVCHAPLAQPPSPLSTLALRWLRPPSSAAWAEFLSASASGCVERDFALLTLSDSEQRELYEAARVIQNTFRRYKGRRLKEQQDRAAAVIQRCYRKYKQLTWTSLKYALYKKMTQAAILIQSKFRSYYEQKKFQQSRRAAVLIQQYYRSYKEYERLKQGHRAPGPLNPKTKSSFLTKKQDQAARKIMRFFRRCRHRIKELKQSKELEKMQKKGLTT